MRYIIILFILSFASSVVPAQPTKIAGHIYDIQSDLHIADCHIYLVDGKNDVAATTSNGDGYFRFNSAIVTGMSLRVTHVNYKSKQLKIANVTDSFC
ncbi:MAG: carboxypeptidase-like regulatory domain-containing protein, partial [Bacteroides sp.]|nr:carboxypeptidase-like regulatory domain-containing protein [Bacteroides sp.]